MARFDEKSRYANPALETYAVIDARGREVRALPIPEASPEVPVGEHVRKEGQSLDQIAAGYLRDPHGYWRLCETNDVLLVDALDEQETITIPHPIR